MDGPQFHVELPTLEKAAAGIAESIDDQATALSKLPAGSQEYGDNDLYDALKNYCDRWSDGLDILTEDARKISDSLKGAAAAYRATDAAVAGTADPGLGAVDD